MGLAPPPHEQRRIDSNRQVGNAAALHSLPSRIFDSAFLQSGRLGGRRHREADEGREGRVDLSAEHLAELVALFSLLHA